VPDGLSRVRSIAATFTTAVGNEIISSKSILEALIAVRVGYATAVVRGRCVHDIHLLATADSFVLL
jgi:hypothetical protein